MSKTRTFHKIHEIWHVKATCALCGFETSQFRTIRKGHKGKLLEGYYKPHLSIDELWRLREGEHTICTNRRDCAYRQMKQTQ